MMSAFGLLRTGNCTMALLGVLIGAMVEYDPAAMVAASGPATVIGLPVSHLALLLPSGTFMMYINVLLAAVVAFLVTGAGNALNDYYDRDLDRKAHPDRPIPSGRVTAEEAYRFAIALFVVGIALSVLINVACILFAAINSGLLLAYEARLKATGLAGNVTISYLTASVFLFGGASVLGFLLVLVLFLLAMLANVGREVAKDIEDMEADKGHRRTLPITRGASSARTTAVAAVVLAVVLSPLPFIARYVPALEGILLEGSHFSPTVYMVVVLVADAIFIYSCSLLTKEPGRSQSMMKAAMFIALMAFFIGAVLEAVLPNAGM